MGSLLRKLFVLHLILALLGGWVVLHFMAPYWLIVPPIPAEAELAPELAESLAWSEPLEWRSEDGLKLRALRFPAVAAQGRFVVLHGIGSRKEDQLGVCQWLNELGFEAVAVDLRAHGESEGKYTTFGCLEQRDLSAFLDAFPSELDSHLFGGSLGGAIALQALARDARWKSAVVLSAFSSVDEIALDRQERAIGVRWRWPWRYVRWRCESIAEMDTDFRSPEEACRTISQPVFFAHGVSDLQIPIEHARRNHAALRTADKVLLEVEGAGHDDLWTVGGAGLKEALERFVRARGRE